MHIRPAPLRNHSLLESVFDEFFDSLQSLSCKGAQSSPERALEHAFSKGLSFDSRNRFGESLLEGCARLRAQCLCIALMDMGAEPFSPPQSTDFLGAWVRLRPFEAFIAADLPDALLRAAKGLNIEKLSVEQDRWLELQENTHSQLRLWGHGSGWHHLASASGSLACLRALKNLGIDMESLDCSGSGPLMSCAYSKRAGEGCAEQLMLWGADPWARNYSGDCAAEARPASWAGLGARAESLLLLASCSPLSGEQKTEEEAKGKSKSL